MSIELIESGVVGVNFMLAGNMVIVKQRADEAYGYLFDYLSICLLQWLLSRTNLPSVQ